MNIELKTNYNVVLFDLLDSASKWDYFVNSHIRKWLDDNFEVDEQPLEKYANIRSEFGWGAQASLHNWAYSGFNNTIEISTPNGYDKSDLEQIKEILEEFKTFKKTNDGKTLGETVYEFAKITEEKKLLLEEILKDYNFDWILAKADKLFTSEKKKLDIVNTYMLFSPNNYGIQGGANGDGISFQIRESDTKENLGVVISMITHEYFHKRLSPAATFEEWNEIKSINGKYDYLWEGNQELTDYLEELVIYSLVNVKLFGANAKQMHLSLQEKNNTKYSEIWGRVARFHPILDEYIFTENVEKAKAEIIDFAQKLAKNEL